jgi:hypothetical protein
MQLDGLKDGRGNTVKAGSECEILGEVHYQGGQVRGEAFGRFILVE